MTNCVSDPRLLGARSVARISDTRVVVACRDSRRLVVLEHSAQHGWQITGETGDIGSEPARVIYFNAQAWTVTRDGYVRAFTV